jgi:hypothetical protein
MEYALILDGTNSKESTAFIANKFKSHPKDDHVYVFQSTLDALSLRSATSQVMKKLNDDMRETQLIKPGERFGYSIHKLVKKKK